MKIELKNIQHFNELSGERSAFFANLYVNDKRIAACTDDGNGGFINIRVIKGCESILSQAEEFAKTLPNEPIFNLQMNLEMLIGSLASEDLWQQIVHDTLKEHENLHIVSGKSRSEFRFDYMGGNNKYKVPINVVLAQPDLRIELRKQLDTLKAQGYTIYNKNIPKEMIDEITLNPKR